MSIEKIVENIDSMRELFEKYGFLNVRLFKGFLTGVDDKTCYLVVSLQPEEKEWLSVVTKQQELEKDLKELLDFYVGIIQEGSMETAFLEKINLPGKSVNLSKLTEKPNLKEELKNYLGKEWQFNSINPYVENEFNSTRTEAPSISKEENDLISQVPSVFTQPLEGSNKENIETVEKCMNELNSKLSELTADQLVLFKEKLIQSIDKKLSEAQPNQNSQSVNL